MISNLLFHAESPINNASRNNRTHLQFEAPSVSTDNFRRPAEKTGQARFPESVLARGPRRGPKAGRTCGACRASFRPCRATPRNYSSIPRIIRTRSVSRETKRASTRHTSRPRLYIPRDKLNGGSKMDAVRIPFESRSGTRSARRFFAREKDWAA